MNWKRALIALMTRNPYKQFILDTKEPEIARERLWKDEMLPLLKCSSFWQERLGNNPIPDLESFPITTYEDYEPALSASLDKEINSLNGEEIVFWSESSGTTGKRKYFPVTKSFQTQFQRTMAPFIYSLTQRFSDFFKDKLLYLVARNPTEFTPSGKEKGFISNFNYRHLPKLIKKSYAIPDAVLINDAVFSQWAPLYALAADLNVIFSIVPMSMSAFYALCAEQFDGLIPYLLGEKKLPGHLPALTITKKRRLYLQSIAKSAPHTRTYRTLWPSLKFACCWISGPCVYPAKQLAEDLGPDVSLIDGTYSATEGWMTVPLETGCLGGILHPGAHIVEFIEEGIEDIRENLVQSWDLESGKFYKVYLTTAMGLVRYQLKDVVKCTGFYNNAPRLEFGYKSSMIKLEYISISEKELMKALSQVSFTLEPHWYFARSAAGNKIILVTDDESVIDKTLVDRLHKALEKISEGYAHYASVGEVQTPELRQVSIATMMRNTHAQTKPKFISQETVS